MNLKYLLLLSVIIPSILCCQIHDDIKTVISISNKVIDGLEEVVDTALDYSKGPLSTLLHWGRYIPQAAAYIPYLEDAILNKCDDFTPQLTKILDGNLKIAQSVSRLREELLETLDHQFCYQQLAEHELKILGALKTWEMIIKEKDYNHKKQLETVFIDLCDNGSCQTSLDALVSSMRGSGLFGCDILDLMYKEDGSETRVDLSRNSAYLVTLVSSGMTMISYYYSLTTEYYDVKKIMEILHSEAFSDALQRVENVLKKPAFNSGALVSIPQLNSSYQCLKDKFSFLLVDLADGGAENWPTLKALSKVFTDIILNVREKTLQYTLPSNFSGTVWFRPNKKEKYLLNTLSTFNQTLGRRGVQFGIAGDPSLIGSFKTSALNELPFFTEGSIQSQSSQLAGSCSEWVDVCGQRVRKCKKVLN